MFGFFKMQLDNGLFITMGNWRFRATGGKVSLWRYFKDEEVVGLDKELVAMLDMARDKAGVPFILTSGFRSTDQNAALNGAAKDSAHLKGLAVDIAVSGDDHILNRMQAGLYAAGFVRMGLYFSLEGSKLVPRHIHVDISRDAAHPQEVTWSLLEAN